MSNTDDAAERVMSSEVLARLVEGHARFLAFVEKRVGSRQVAEDLLQEAFARAVERGDSLREGESATAWFYRLLRNALIDHYRRRGSEQRALDAVARESETETAGDDELAAVCECLVPIVDTLKPAYAEAVRSVDLEERSLADYAAQAGITTNNAAVRLHRAREALHKQLVVSCGTCSTHGCLDCSCSASH